MCVELVLVVCVSKLHCKLVMLVYFSFAMKAIIYKNKEDRYHSLVSIVFENEVGHNQFFGHSDYYSRKVQQMAQALGVPYIVPKRWVTICYHFNHFEPTLSLIRAIIQGKIHSRKNGTRAHAHAHTSTHTHTLTVWFNTLQLCGWKTSRG